MTHPRTTMTRRRAIATLGLGFAATSRLIAQEGGAGGLKLLSVRKIWSGGGHNAFTGLVRHRDRWFCVFRESTDHIPGTDGVIRVLTSEDGRDWTAAAAVTEEGVDLRDPKIDVMPDGRLMVLMGGSYYAGPNGQPNRRFDHARSRASFSADGRTWSAPAPVSLKDQWLWRVTWHENTGYGFAYRVDEAAKTSDITLWKTTDGLTYERIADPKLPAGVRPDESTIRFRAEGSMVALVRNDAKPGHAFLGTSRAPYTSWAWSDAGHAAQGPDFLILPDGRMIYAGRDYPGGPKTVVGFMTPERLTPELTLPSGGDTSYPGLVWHDGRLWISYYASHEGRTSVYLAEVEVTH